MAANRREWLMEMWSELPLSSGAPSASWLSTALGAT
jgi:hypothetical protein